MRAFHNSTAADIFTSHLGRTLPPGWRTERVPEGRVFYIHDARQHTQWEWPLPDGAERDDPGTPPTYAIKAEADEGGSRGCNMLRGDNWAKIFGTYVIVHDCVLFRKTLILL